MNQPLYGVWLGDAFFCFSGEVSEPKVDAWSRVVRAVRMQDGSRPFANATLRLAELRYPSPTYGARSTRRPERKMVGGRTMEGLALTPGDAFQMLLELTPANYEAQGLAAGEEMEFWIQASRFALQLLLQGKLAPGTAEVPAVGRRRTTMQSIRAVWKPQLSGEDSERFMHLAANIPPVCIGVPAALAGHDPSTREEAGAIVLYSFLCGILNSEAREAVRETQDKLRPHLANYRRGHSPLAELWWNSLLTVNRELPVQGTAEEIGELTSAVEAAGGTSVPYAAGEDAPPESGTVGLGLRLEPPLTDNRQDWQISFWARGLEDEGLLLPAGSIWGMAEPDPLIRGRIYSSVKQQLLLRLGEAAELAPELAEGLRGPAPDGATIPLSALSSFMKDSVPRLARRGVTVQMPSRWSKEGRRRVGLSLKMMSDARSPGGMHPLPVMGMEHLVRFEISAAMGGQRLTRDELKSLAEQNLPYVQFRGEWVEVDLKEINQVLRFMKRHEKGEMELAEWMHLTAEMDGERLWKGLFIEEVESAGLLSSLLEGEFIRKVPPRPVPSTLHGELRPYQERGYQWLSMMRDMGFGVCLADDMGLGKTIQVITCLLDRRESDGETGPVLIICPTSLLGNWQRELQRFAPELSLHVHHGVRRLRGEEFTQKTKEYDVVLTTYHLAGRDGGDLSGIRWSSVVLDEAQYIKNYRTKQAQSVMKLSAPHRIAMTGTPVENRLAELWSIFHFLNPGYLGSFHAFRQRYAAGEGQQERYRELHRLVSPFMLRRLKSDPDIRKDLPEKLEVKSYCTLTEVQGAMYQAVVDEMMGQIETQTGMARKGLVLSSLTKLKQICDHPQLLRQEEGRAVRAEASGKMERMLEILDQIADMGESALIFTQYVGMGELLVNVLGRKYGKKPHFLHGGVPKRERDEMVRAFQNGEGTEFFVLSLKAGGVGLNLTRANHVLHYDRWWNPAVENQATDRVFRIGQHRNVQVHKLICQGTLEERIDELIEQKKALSEQVVGSGETWLTEMSDGELRRLIELQGQDWM
ncbi:MULTISPECIES: DEAD/DEAH box helicase [Paenibacillus]|uniref:SNF2-related protein n=1 Tax=Paenibacillus lactis 154 TaxID=743719 RepID=G4HH01_9BACL|nr:DEAD/DEAH box helicase [Paenibacillus lactis]EHB63377.1 SNF2-related protein [Paenibacillus lactis 154]GIO88900.1 helicase HelZ [Paenibacillus lactis]